MGPSRAPWDPSVSDVFQLKLSRHPTGLTANLLKLFEPRPPLEYTPPIGKCKLPAHTSEKKARIGQIKLEQRAAKVAEELQKQL